MIRTLSRALRLAALAGVLALGGLNAPASAQAPQAAPTPDAETLNELEQIPLTEDSVARLIESFPVFKAKAEELSERYPELDDRSPGRHLSSLAAYPVAMAEIQAVIGAYGFDDIETYMRTLQTAAMTAAILDLEAERGMSLQEQIDAQVQQLQNNPQIPENMRAQVLQMLEAQLEQVRRMEPLPGNREAVAPHAAELRALLDDPEQPR